MKDINENKTPQCAVGLGIFDGVHLGHRAILKCVTDMACDGLVPAVFTFDTQSLKRKHGDVFRYIYTDRQKKDILTGLGIKYVYSRAFSELKNLSGEEFVREILLKKMNAKAVLCGKNFRFGSGAECGAEELSLLGEKYGFKTIASGLVEKRGDAVSSERVRSLILEGNMKNASELLGESYFIEETVVTGNMLGRQLNFPTINQYYGENQLAPVFGVYASRTLIDGKYYPSITNVGVKPTVKSDGRVLAETHILGYCADLYGRVLRVELDEFIRHEQKFSSVEELKIRVNMDIDGVKKVYSKGI